MSLRPPYFLVTIGLTSALLSGKAYSLFVDGHGYYGLRGETRTKPEFQSSSSAHQAIDQFFRLETELRVNDQASVFLEFRLFDDERDSYLGDKTQSQPCPTGASDADDANCKINAQNSGEPRYQFYNPTVRKAYAIYSMDYCLLSIGRRGRNWGMGMFLDDGTKPFSIDASIFDGITCDINIQKSQTLGFSVGYDKIGETGASILSSGQPNQSYGPTNNGDDLDQFFFTIEFNDHRANVGKSFSKQIGIYFANVIGGKETKTDLKFADLYLNFLLQDLVFQNEVLFRLGRSGDPNWSRMGAARTRDSDEKIDNELQSIGLAGSVEYYLSRSGAYLGPKEYSQGNATSHSLFMAYAYAPGDSDGYYPEYPNDEVASQRDKQVRAMAFHQNFKPALLLFNGRKKSDSLRIDGIFDPNRVLNATVFQTGYRYKSLENGDFEAKLVTGKLNELIPTELKVSGNERIGFYSSNLGFELDLSYSRLISRDFEFGVTGALGIAGDAWKVTADKAAENSYLLQSYAVLKF